MECKACHQCTVFDTGCEKRCLTCFEPYEEEVVAEVSFDCPNCGKYYEDTCFSCGYQDKQNISQEQEWRDFGVGDGASRAASSSRVGMASSGLFSESYSGGTIMNLGRGATYAQRRLRKIDFHQTSNHRDRALLNMYNIMERACDHLGVGGEVKDLCKRIYKYYNEKASITRGNVRLGILANCVQTACKHKKITRTTHEIANAFGDTTLNHKDISRTFEQFYQTVKDHPILVSAVSHTIEASDVVSRLMNCLSGLSDDQRRRLAAQARKHLRTAQTVPELVSRTPTAVACAVIVTITAKLLTKDEVCKACNVSKPTVNKIEKIIKQKMCI